MASLHESLPPASISEFAELNHLAEFTILRIVSKGKGVEGGRCGFRQAEARDELFNFSTPVNNHFCGHCRPGHLPVIALVGRRQESLPPTLTDGALAGLQGSLRKACISKDDSNLLTQSTILICKQGNGHGVCACPCNHLGVAQDRIAKTIKILHSELVPGHSTLKHKDWRYT